MLFRKMYNALLKLLNTRTEEADQELRNRPRMDFFIPAYVLVQLPYGKPRRMAWIDDQYGRVVRAVLWCDRRSDVSPTWYNLETGASIRPAFPEEL